MPDAARRANENLCRPTATEIDQIDDQIAALAGPGAAGWPSGSRGNAR
jgi:hypothetical protein